MFVIWKTLSYNIFSYNHDGKNLKKIWKKIINQHWIKINWISHVISSSTLSCILWRIITIRKQEILFEKMSEQKIEIENLQDNLITMFSNRNLTNKCDICDNVLKTISTFLNTLKMIMIVKKIYRDVIFALIILTQK